MRLNNTLNVNFVLGVCQARHISFHLPYKARDSGRNRKYKGRAQASCRLARTSGRFIASQAFVNKISLLIEIASNESDKRLACTKFKPTDMKHSIRLILICLVLLASTQLKAQQSVRIKQDSTRQVQTLFQGKIKSVGISVSPTFQFGPIGPQAGIALAIHLNNHWEIGGSFARTAPQHHDDLTITPRLGQQFHAFSVAYTPKANRLVHLSFPLLIGAITSQNEVLPKAIMDPYTAGNPILGGQGGIRESSMFWNGPKSLGIQPGIQVELNVLKHLRVFTGANYRFAMGENSTDAMRGFVGTLGLKVGMFDKTLRTKKK